jgi:hypothetical protein
MKADSFSRRLATLEDDPDQDTVLVAHQWLHEGGTPAGEMVERWIPRNRVFNFEWIDEK